MRFYIKLGLKIKKIHREFEFNQLQQLQSYKKKIEAENNNDEYKKSLYMLSTLCFSISNLCYVFNINLLFFMNSSWLSLKLSPLILLFYRGFILFSS